MIFRVCFVLLFSVGCAGDDMCYICCDGGCDVAVFICARRCCMMRGCDIWFVL